MSGLRPDQQIIAANISEGTRVLDVGCGDGALMQELAARKAADVRGLEIDPAKAATALAKGLAVAQGDALTDLAYYPDQSFDYAILSQTLQMVQRPDRMLDQLVRVGRQTFVSFPNFAHWRVRMSLLLGGRMPVTRLIPEQWYDTPNIHHVTIDDFRALIRDKVLRQEGQWFLSGDKQTGATGANLLAEHAVFLLRQ